MTGGIPTAGSRRNGQNAIPGTLDLGSAVRGMGNYPAFFGTGQQVYIFGQPASDDDRHQRGHGHTGTYPQ